MALPKLEDCKPGQRMAEYKILILPESTDERTAAGLYIPPTVKDIKDMASMRGLLVAVSPRAFNFDTLPDGGRDPMVGDVVLFSKYAGTLITGKDGREYRACLDRDIISIEEDE